MVQADAQVIMWQKRHALQIASQLPDNPDDARLVLQLAKDIIDRLYAPSPSATTGVVLSLVEHFAE
jgi:hypothetical protein